MIVKDKEYYVKTFDEKWNRCLKLAKDDIHENGGAADIIPDIATEIFEECANAEDVVGYYIAYHGDDALNIWIENTKEIHFSEQDDEVDRILRDLYPDSKEIQDRLNKMIVEEAARQWCEFIDDAPERKDGEGFWEFLLEIAEQKKEEYMEQLKEAVECTPRTLEQTIKIPKKEMEYINKLLTMTGDEIYQKYGLKRDETIVHTAQFPDNIEVDIKLVICDGDDTPFTEAVLFQNGRECAMTPVEFEYDGEWCLEYDGNEYIVNVITEN